VPVGAGEAAKDAQVELGLAVEEAETAHRVEAGNRAERGPERRRTVGGGDGGSSGCGSAGAPARAGIQRSSVA
jgi:hypothetical protein